MHLRLSMMNPYRIRNFLGPATELPRGLGIVADYEAGISDRLEAPDRAVWNLRNEAILPACPAR